MFQQWGKLWGCSLCVPLLTIETHIFMVRRLNSVKDSFQTCWPLTVETMDIRGQTKYKRSIYSTAIHQDCRNPILSRILVTHFPAPISRNISNIKGHVSMYSSFVGGMSISREISCDHWSICTQAFSFDACDRTRICRHTRRLRYECVLSHNAKRSFSAVIRQG